MRIVSWLALALCGGALSGCVSVFEGTSQDIAVNSTPPGATCVFEREGQQIGTIVSTPGTLTVRKSKFDITVTCNKPGYQQSALINNSGTTAAIAANIIVDVLLTAGISSIVDSANGADNKYEETMNFNLAPFPPSVVGGATGPTALSGTAAPAVAAPAAINANGTTKP